MYFFKSAVLPSPFPCSSIVASIKALTVTLTWLMSLGISQSRARLPEAILGSSLNDVVLSRNGLMETLLDLDRKAKELSHIHNI